MSMRFRWLRRILTVVAVLGAVGLLAVAPALLKMDLGADGRAVWQLPDRVIDSLRIQPGDRVADVGAGDGYFTFRLAATVGPSGRVYAVEVEDALEENVREGGHENVVVLKGEYGDPLLPDGAIDLVFLCNTFHHIEDRVAYFDRLRGDLAEGGRVALIDLRGILLVRFFVPHGHWTTVETMAEEMAQASYRLDEDFDFLPAQGFAVFSPR
jgi:arsenite methyltransferase